MTGVLSYSTGLRSVWCSSASAASSCRPHGKPLPPPLPLLSPLRRGECSEEHVVVPRSRSTTTTSSMAEERSVDMKRLGECTPIRKGIGAER